MVFIGRAGCVSHVEPDRDGIHPHLSNEVTEEAMNPGKLKCWHLLGRNARVSCSCSLAREGQVRRYLGGGGWGAIIVPWALHWPSWAGRGPPVSRALFPKGPVEAEGLLRGLEGQRGTQHQPKAPPQARSPATSSTTPDVQGFTSARPGPWAALGSGGLPLYCVRSPRSSLPWDPCRQALTP